MQRFQPSVALVKVPVTDFARGRAFYTEVLGLEEEFAEAAYGWAQYRCGEIPLCLYVVGMGGGDGVPGGETNFHLAVSDIEAAYTLLQERGVAFQCELVKSDDGGSFFMVADPDGNTFKIVQGE